MYTSNGIDMFFIDEALATPFDRIETPNDQHEGYVDLPTWIPISRLLDSKEIYRNDQKITPTRTSMSQTVTGNPELRPAAVPSEHLDGIPQQAIHARGELALMRAVLSDAIYCYQKRFVSKDWRAYRPGNEAEAWFADNDERWPFSFINICRVLALDPDYLRRGLKLWQERITTIVATESQRQAALSCQLLRSVP